MSPRVYLMVDTGDGPKVAATLAPGNWPGQGPIPGTYRNAQRIEAAKAACRAWWLVEAESADAARKCIACYVAGDRGPLSFAMGPGGIQPGRHVLPVAYRNEATGEPLGRILASRGSK